MGRPPRKAMSSALIVLFLHDHIFHAQVTCGVISVLHHSKILSLREYFITWLNSCWTKSRYHLKDKRTKHMLGGLIELWDTNEVQLIENEI